MNFEDSVDEESSALWYKIKILSSLWASVTKDFLNDTSFFFIHHNWLAGASRFNGYLSLSLFLPPFPSLDGLFL